MLRVLILLEDYNELVFVQTLLKKLGFDVEAIQKQSQLENSILSFNPHGILMTAKGRRINGIEASAKIRRHNNLPFVILLKDKNQFITEKYDPELIDEILEHPINILKIVELLCQFGNLDEKAVKTKLSGILTSTAIKEKSRGAPDESSPLQEDESQYANELSLESVEKPVLTEQDSREAKGQSKEQVAAKVHESANAENKVAPKLHSSISPQERREKYKHFVNDLDSKPKGLGGFSRRHIKTYNSQSVSKEYTEDMKELDENKKKFVNKLYEDN